MFKRFSCLVHSTYKDWKFSSPPIIRYGEQNPCFSVATFANDEEEDKDVAKKVTSALERVTSDYHSGSSSDEESVHTSPLTISNSRCSYQVLHNIFYNSYD